MAPVRSWVHEQAVRPDPETLDDDRIFVELDRLCLLHCIKIGLSNNPRLHRRLFDAVVSSPASAGRVGRYF